MNPSDYYDDEPLDDGPSKSQKKREMHALQTMGDALVALGKDQLKKLQLPERLFDAIMEAKRLTAHGAIRRQSQYIGKLMRHVDAAPIQAYLDQLTQSSSAQTAWLHRIERWRDKLVSDSNAITLFADEFPEADIQQVRQLVRNALKERELNKPPKAYRELFQLLKALQPPPIPVSEPTDEDLEDEDMEDDDE
ncbi:ribosome biogenesis factor YjgA [Leeia oryzae]|uniref:ribosome biogenesis factor YjgA n=1 Tax=Leeia oryzae TaxID=356662 RepID=UPI00037F57B0|nr:ribosome biogenesis factor YjgA [Leeia oryzae]